MRLRLLLLISITAVMIADVPHVSGADRRSGVRLFGLGRSRKTDGDEKKSRMTPAQLQVDTVAKGTSSRAEMRTARERLPLDKLTTTNKASVIQILDKAVLLRRLPVLSYEVDPRVYQYFLDHPDAAVSIWRVMDISRFEMNQISSVEYEADARDGSSGVITVLHRTPRESLVMCDGVYKNSLLRKAIASRGLLHLTSSFQQTKDGRWRVTQNATVFVAFPSQTVKTVARIISPVTNVIMDRNMVEVSMFLRLMCVAMRNQPGWVDNVAGEMDGVSENSRDQLRRLCARVYVDEKKRLGESSPTPVAVDEISKPLRKVTISTDLNGNTPSTRPPTRTANNGRATIRSQ